MDPFSLVTGVAGLLSLAGQVISQCYRYGCAVSDAPKEAKRLVSEVTSLSGLLVGLQGLVQQDDFPGQDVKLILGECNISLSSLLSRLQSHSPENSKSTTERALRRLLWPLRKSDTEELTSSIGRQKASLSLALDTYSAGALLKQQSVLEDVSNTLSDLSLDFKANQAIQQRQQILDWLSDHQYEAQYRRGLQIHCSKTCGWLLKHHEFIKWSSCRSSLLWMHGQAGSGKTVATSYLIHHITSRQSDHETMVGYFYYDASTVESLTPETFFGAIVKQFCSQLPKMHSEVLEAYERALSRQGTPKQASLNELQRFLTQLLKADKSAVIVIDGLDESPDFAVVCDFLTSKVECGHYPLRVFISSRPERDLRRRLHKFQEIPFPESAIEQDIGVYIKSRIENDNRLCRMSQKMKDHVVFSLQGDSHGMFRWVQCQLDEISRLRTDAAIKKALNQLPSSIEGAYARILQSISQGDAVYARRALLWLAHATTPLSLAELAEAVILEPKFDRLDSEAELNDPNDILEICGSLVAYNVVSGTARLAHHSVREYLSGSLKQDSYFYMPARSSHRTMAEACLSYILLEDFAEGPFHGSDFDQMLESFPLIRYAAQKWPSHVRRSGAEKEMLPLILRLMTPKTNRKFLFWLQVVLFDSRHGYVQPSEDLARARPLYYAASYGLTETLRSLVAMGVDLNERAGRYGGTAMHAAVWRERPECLQILLDAGADCSIMDDNETTPPQLARWSGKKAICDIFPREVRVNQMWS
ncbi:hypothetical protein LTR10_020861 [Elasticomyces elasticus]|uniref:NACHT domain-containing protein n=1 Tax=Exophiala sideris TaxID=1016849 RepID=A0ABR0J8I2_9EURO|nr:hypothetical protein LTR10_020861 [Elasticomyces elasticus]KAK5025556.1 hypothetical protein LTR13_010395 [Exophiala sideris]KAK5029829.1 hypothetical protein LTS07_005553 [Exophiala sideris]KAK5058410.1 hypothetical protein LTR69_006815 [Exophiala sideris]KAK5178617.1 hypothetical protein LTR44_008988 [Eurotiomycetes sp. CCFEE 6388]